MTFQQLIYVVEISKCGSINKAAHKLLLSQSGISSAVRELEEELGIQFFIRSNRGVEFTPEGKEFLSYAISLLEQKERIEKLYNDPQSKTAPARFSVSTQRYPFTENAFLQFIQATQDHPFRLSIRETGIDGVIDDVDTHQADIGVICMTGLTEKIICRLLDSRNLTFHEIANVAPCVYVRKSHPLAGFTSVSEHDLTRYPYVSFEQAQGGAADFSEEYQMMSAKRPERCISVNNRATMMNVLTQTDAFTTGSGLLLESPISQGIITIPLTGQTNIRIGWIAPSVNQHSPQTDLFIRLLEESIADSIAFTSQLHQSLTAPN